MTPTEHSPLPQPGRTADGRYCLTCPDCGQVSGYVSELEDVEPCLCRQCEAQIAALKVHSTEYWRKYDYYEGRPRD